MVILQMYPTPWHKSGLDGKQQKLRLFRILKSVQKLAYNASRICSEKTIALNVNMWYNASK